MTLPTASNSSLPGEKTGAAPVIRLQDVAVRYRVPQERIATFKEYAIRWLRGQIRYQSFWALQDINLEIQPGEVFGIIGPNGAGKSTLLKVIARVLFPTRGRVQIAGRVAPLLELGAGFDQELTGRENVYLNAGLLGYTIAQIDAMFADIVAFSGLQDFIDAPLRTYSTGMFARLGFSVATAARPDVLIVDEILGVGDAEFQTKSFERIQNFQAEGTTILLVSHSLDRVEAICSRALWLDHGKIIALGSAASVVNQYLTHSRDQESSRLSAEFGRSNQSRWGTGKIEITRVRLTGLDGSEQSIFETGQPFVLHMDYIAHQPLPGAIFGMAIHRQDGVHITGPNTSQAGLEMPELSGPGSVTFRVNHLPLLEGLYRLTVASTNLADTEIYDYHDRNYFFRVVNANRPRPEKYGLMTLGGEWELYPSSAGMRPE